MAAPSFVNASAADESSTPTVSINLLAGNVLYVLAFYIAVVFDAINWNTSEAVGEIASAGGGGGRKAKLYKLAGGTTGTHNVVGTPNVGTVAPGIIAWQEQDNDATTPASNGNSATATNTTPTINISSATGKTAIACYVTDNAHSLSATSGTARFDVTTANYRMVLLDAAGGASVTLGGTQNGGSAEWIMVGASLNEPAASAVVEDENDPNALMRRQYMAQQAERDRRIATVFAELRCGREREIARRVRRCA